MGNALDDFAKNGGGRTKDKPAPKSKKSGGNALDDYVNGKTSAATKTPASGAKKSPGLFKRATQIVAGVPKGLASFAIGVPRDIGETAWRLGPGENTEQAPGESLVQATERQYPTLGGLIASLDRSAGRVMHPSKAVADYKADPLGTLLEDVSNVALFAGPAAKAAGGTGKVATAAKVVNKVADAPVVPFRVAGRAAVTGFERAAASPGTIGQVLRSARMDPQSRSVRNQVLNPAVEQIAELTGETVARSKKVEALLPHPHEQIASMLIGEGEASGLAALRRNLGDDAFDAHVRATFGDAVPVEAARLATDVHAQRTAGATPEAGTLPERISAALAVGRDEPGGRRDRLGAYLAEGVPGRDEQVGFRPLSQVVDQATKRVDEQAEKASKLAGSLRARADNTAERSAAAVAASASPRTASAARQAEAAAKRYAAAKTRVDATRERAARAGEAARTLSAAERVKIERRYAKALEADVKDFRRAHAEQLRAEADSLLSTLPEDAPRLPPKFLDRRAGVRHPARDHADELIRQIGAGYAGRRLFTGGNSFDVWLDMAARRLNMADDSGSGVGADRIVQHVAKTINEARRLRREAQQIERGQVGVGPVPAGRRKDVAAAGAKRAAGAVDEHENLLDRAVANAARIAAGEDAPAPTALEKRIAASMAAGREAGKAGAKADAALEGVKRPLFAAVAAGRRSGEAVGAATERARNAADIARRAEDVAGRVAQRAEVTRRAAEESVEAAPARLRPALIRNREAAQILMGQAKKLSAAGDLDAAKLLRDEARALPRTLEQLAKDGADFEHFIHVRIGDRPGQAGVRGGPNLPRVRKGREQKVRTGAQGYDRTVRAQAQAELDQVRNAVAKQAARKIGSMPGVSRKFKTVKEAKEAGFVAWDPKSPFEKSAQITRTTTFIPEHVFEGFRTYFQDPKFERILQATYDKATTGFKVSVLALSPSWQVGNVFGNIILATAAGGVGPVRLAAEMTKNLRAYRKAGGWDKVAPRRLFSAGPTHEEFAYLGGDSPVGAGKLRKAGHKAMAPARASFRMNGFVDDLTRSAVYTAKVGRGASPDVALRQALNAMGDFSRMTPFERRVIRRIIPFYAWQRHITQLAFRLPVENPRRTAWIMHLANLYGSDAEELPGMTAGSIPLPGTNMRLGTTGLNPFGRLGVTLDPGKLPASVNPLLKIPAQSATGINAWSGKPFTRPPGSGKHDDYGRPVPTAPSLRKQITDIPPQKRLFDALMGRDEVVRYDTGDPIITAGGPLRTSRTKAQAVSRFFGFPLFSEEEVEAMRKRLEENRKKEAKARQRYESRRDKFDESLPRAGR